MAMARKLTKALRSKRRWIGCLYSGFSSRNELKDYLQDLPVRLFDMVNGKCILQVKLEDYSALKQALTSGKVISQTSSGKIRLVRQRLEIDRPPRKR